MPFREVIRPPLWLFAFLTFLFLSLIFSIWAALDISATLWATGVSALLLAFIFFRSPMIIVIDDELRVDGAHLEKKFVKRVQVLTPAELRALRTRDADPAAFLAIRFWCDRGVKIELQDPRDPTPYWLVSSKKGNEIKKALEL